MNWRQEVVVVLCGLAIAGMSLAHGVETGSFIHTAIFPVLLVGAVLVFTLRTRSQAAATREAIGVALAATILLAAAVADHATSSIRDGFDTIASSVDSSAGGMTDAAQMLSRALDDVGTSIESAGFTIAR